jgi:predicted transcriptional regulator
MKKIILVSSILISLLSASVVGEVPKSITIEEQNGALVSGEPWHSSMLKDKVYVLFYIDPDEKDTNNDFSEALKKRGYDLKTFGTVAIINLDATWLPNFAIESSLKSKQKEYPNTTYVKDKTKYLVKEWGLADDSSDISVFAKDGKLLYHYSGKLAKEEIAKVLKLIDENI